MKYILITNRDQLVVGPFDTAEDAQSYAVNVLNNVNFSVYLVQPPISVSNMRLLAQASQ